MAVQLSRHLLGIVGSMGKLSWNSLERNLHIWLGLCAYGTIPDLGVPDFVLDVDFWTCQGQLSWH